MGVRKSHDILKAFTKRSSLRSKLRTLGFPVVDEAMVDVLGILVYTNVVFVLLYWDVFPYNSHNDFRIHIGVGFEVAYLYRVVSSKTRNVR